MADGYYAEPNRQGAFGSSYNSFQSQNVDREQNDADNARYDQQGYDQSGYDQSGYEQQGYEQSYDQTGYDEAAYANAQYEQYAESGYVYPTEQTAQQQQQQYAEVPHNNWQTAQSGVEQSMASMNINQRNQQAYAQQSGNSSWSNSGNIIPDGVVPVDPRFMVSSCAAFPSSTAVRLSSNIPLSLTVQPLAEVEMVEWPDSPEGRVPGEGPLPCVNFGSMGVVRCKACRTYINPYVKWQDGGQRWRCCMCGRSNDVPSQYFSELDRNGCRTDQAQRIELSLSSYEIVAPAEYMVRPPQPPAFVFAIDVSLNAIESGMLSTVCSAISSLLDSMNESRTRVAFLTFDSSIHLYSLRPTLKRPEMMVLSNLDDLFLPSPEDFLVNLDESRVLVAALLQSLPSMHANTANVESAFGAAVLSAYRLGCATGGKVMFFASGIPSIGPARLKNREAKAGDATKDISILKPSLDFYKHWAVKYTRVQLAADVFVMSNAYSDVATLSALTQFTGGQLYHYTYSRSSPGSDQLFGDICRCVTREQSWEAVMRLRVSKGAKMTGFFGNFFLRGQDLLAVPNCTADSTFVIEVSHEDEQSVKDAVYCQTALLYTTTYGERRIRVHNMALPVISRIEDLFHYVDVSNVVTLVAKKAVEVLLSKSLVASRELIQQSCISLLSGWRKSSGSFKPLSSPEDYPEALATLPLMTLALLKHPAFSDVSKIHSDEHSFQLSLFRMFGFAEIELFLRPRIFPVHCLSGLEGLMDQDGIVTLPEEINLTRDEMLDSGAYLLDNGVTFYLWLGPEIDGAFLQACFGAPSMGELYRSSALMVPEPSETNSVLARFHGVLEYLRASSTYKQSLQLVKPDTPEEKRFQDMLIYDRTDSVMSFNEFFDFLGRRTS